MSARFQTLSMIRPRPCVRDRRANENGIAMPTISINEGQMRS